MPALAMADYKDTLNLPNTKFEMRAGLAQKEPQLLAQWKADDLYGRIQEARKNAKPFVLHDGPPYANGHLHHGHILNKILKDLVVKDRTMSGFRAAYVPGWDCHGLPIEVQVDKQLGAKKASMSKGELHDACRAYAEEFIQIQREEFERLGVLGRWNDPYKTMSFAYEAATLRALADFVDQGIVYKGLKPVNWCTVHQTALAEAEVEYEDHASPSVYVAFALTNPDKLKLPKDTDVVIWTTTPWTLPANLAVCAHPSFEYVLVSIAGRHRIVAKELLATFCAAMKAPTPEVVRTFTGTELEGLTYKHPLFDRTSPVILGEHVTLEQGTGLVHTAPGHGGEDFDIGRKVGLEVLSPVDGRGVFTDKAGPWAGQHVFAANPSIIQALVEARALLNAPTDTVSHRYAHCWRCHKPIILRATEQWWVSIDKPYAGGGSLRQRSLAALKDVTWIPDYGEARIRGMLEARPDWCLSRQRVWGVPIAVLYCEKCGREHLSSETMRKVAQTLEKEGAAAWYRRSASELLPGLKCAGCGAADFRKEEDILDVWFDSGVSFAAVVEREGFGHGGLDRDDGAPIDLYLEGSDQHRGWFHSSLLCSLAIRQRPPYRQVLTHGFVVDGQGKKISKSKGNFIDPFKAIKENGAEILRLWVAAEDYREDIRLSQEILTRLTDTYRKFRNTTRFLLGSIGDFDPNTDMVAPTEMLELDRYMLGVSLGVTERCRAAYRTYNFHVVVQALNELCTVDLSAFYLDVLKDRLYASAPKSPERRSAQTAIYLMTRDLLRVLAPVLVFTCEEAWSHLPRLAGDPSSVHLALHPGEEEPAAVVKLKNAAQSDAAALRERYELLRAVRGEVNTALEARRKNKEIGASMEAAVTLSAGKDIVGKLRTVSAAALAELFIVSAVEVKAADADPPSGSLVAVEVRGASGKKCERCWQYRDDIGQQTPADVCGRCAKALGARG